MKRILFAVVSIASAALCAAENNSLPASDKQEGKPAAQKSFQIRLLKKLPAPDKQGGKPLMQVLTERKTIRTFAKKPLSEQDLSNILYAAWGINRPDGRRTVPTAINVQNLEVYVTSAEGTFLYEAERNVLIQVSKADLREYSNFRKELGLAAPVSLIYCGKSGERIKDGFTHAHAGSAYQNVYLYCASAGLASVICASCNQEKIAEALGLKDGWQVLYAQVIGYPAE